MIHFFFCWKLIEAVSTIKATIDFLMSFLSAIQYFTADNSIFSCLKSLKELLDFNTLNCIVKYRLRLFFFRFSFAFSFSLSYSSILPLRFQILELLCDFFKKHFSQSFSPAGKLTYSHSYFFIKDLIFNIHSEMF